MAYELSLQLVRELGPVAAKIARHDRDLARQLRRAASSITLNLAEGSHSDAGNRRARFHTAAGSAKETKAALEVADAWKYVNATDALALSDRVVAITYKLAGGPLLLRGAQEQAREVSNEGHRRG
jgi:four helix bundle protein